MKCLYRISDNSNDKVKFKNSTKKHCLENFLLCFPYETITIFADNVLDETFNWLKTYSVDVIRTGSSGDAGSFRLLLEAALTIFEDEEIVYFVEDDYLHLNNSKFLIEEGLQVVDYVSLYDHLDKYIPPIQGGNPLINEDGSEETTIFLTKNSHWKLANSTTFCFATKIKTIKDDRDIFFRNTMGKNCEDFKTFTELRQKQRKIATPIPGSSTHCEIEWASPLVDWENV
jgi:hypothetical protein